MYSRLLNRQINRYLPKELSSHPGLSRFLEAIDSSYRHYEQDNNLSKRALEIISDEYREILNKVHESEEKIRSIIDASSDAIIIVNSQKSIFAHNKVAQSIIEANALYQSDSSLPNITIMVDSGYGEIHEMSLFDLEFNKGSTIVESKICSKTGLLILTLPPS